MSGDRPSGLVWEGSDRSEGGCAERGLHHHRRLPREPEGVDPLQLQVLTHLYDSASINLLRHDGEYARYFYHDFHNRVCHPCGWWNFNIDLQPSKDILDVLEWVKESASTSANSVCSPKE